MQNTIIQLIKETIEHTKYRSKVFVAGGFVRDSILNRDSKDIDLVVEGDSIKVGVDFAWYLYRILNLDHKPVTFERFGTAQIVINNTPIEIVAARKESYNFKDRMPVVEVGAIEDDVHRRDFTINALLWDISNEKYIDLVGGKDDINNKVIRTTGNPSVIFAEDPLRIMRAIRFSTQLDFTISNNTMIAIKNYVKWLKNISNERIHDEFNKILISDNFVKGLNLLRETGILEYMIPEFKALYTIKNQGKYHLKDAWNHTLDVMSNTKPTLEHRLAALLHDVGKGTTMTIDGDDIHFYQHQFISQRIAKRFLNKYKYTNDQVELISNAVLMHMNFVDKMLNKTIRKMVNQYGKEEFLFFTDLGLADSKRSERRALVQDIIDFVNTDDYVPEKQMKMPIDGNDIMRRYALKPGKKVGELLNIEKEFLFEFPDASAQDILLKLDSHMIDQNGVLNIHKQGKLDIVPSIINIDIKI